MDPNVPIDGHGRGPAHGFRLQFSMGRVLSRTFAAYFANLVPVLVFGALALTPYAVFEFFYPYPDVDAIAAELGPDATRDEVRMRAALAVILRNVLVGGLLQIVAGGIAAGTVTYTIFQWLRGARASLGQCLARGLRALLPLVLVSLVIGMCYFLGVIVCIVPGVIVLTMWWVAVPALVVERVGVFRALGRSKQLTNRCRWHVLGCIAVIYLIQIALSMLVVVPLALASDAPLGGEFDAPSRVFVIAGLALSVVVMPLHGVAAAVGYHDLRVSKEGIGEEELAAVFD